MTDQAIEHHGPDDLQNRVQGLGAEFDQLIAETLADQVFPAEVTGLLDSLCKLVQATFADLLDQVQVHWEQGGQSTSADGGPGVREHSVVERFDLSFRPGFRVVLVYRSGVNPTLRYLLSQAIARQFDHLHLRELEYALYADQPDLLRALDDIRVRHAARKEQVNTLENRLLQSEKLAAIGQLAAGVAHEINNPIGYVGSNLNALHDYMNGLLNLIDDLQEMVGKTTPDGARLSELLQRAELEYIRNDLPVLMQESQEGIERVRRTVQDLKDFSRTDSTEYAWADLNEGLKKTLNIVHYELKHRATIVQNLEPLPPVFCSASQLNQVFLNVLLNAGQALENTGEIQLRSYQRDDWVCVEVTDDGVGMTEATRTRLFEPFYTTKPAGEGTGLGLSISMRIVSQHGGRIEVVSTRGVGTTFAIWLPINPETVGSIDHE